jgi:hypothetical protein
MNPVPRRTSNRTQGHPFQSIGEPSIVAQIVAAHMAFVLDPQQAAMVSGDTGKDAWAGCVFAAHAGARN